MSDARNRFPVTVHIVLRRDDEVLLLKRANTGYRDGWSSLVAGHVEVGERIAQAAVREVREEVGLKLKEDELRLLGVLHRKSAEERIDFFLEAASWEGQPENCEPQKCSAIGWYRIQYLPERTVPYIRHALAKVDQPFWFDEFGWREQIASAD